MEVDSYFRFVIALIAVLGIIVALAAVARHMGLGVGRTGFGRKSEARRLAICEVLPLDTKRRLLLIKRDDKEHLILVGPEGDSVIEAGIDIRPGTTLAPQLADATEVRTPNSQGGSA